MGTHGKWLENIAAGNCITHKFITVFKKSLKPSF